MSLIPYGFSQDCESKMHHVSTLHASRNVNNGRQTTEKHIHQVAHSLTHYYHSVFPDTQAYCSLFEINLLRPPKTQDGLSSILWGKDPRK